MTSAIELKAVQTPTLKIAYYCSGPPTAQPLLLLHGFPYSPHQNTALTQHIHTQQPNKYYILNPFLRGSPPTTYLHASTLRSGQQAAIAQDILDFLDALSIPRALLVGYDWGGRAACIVSALHAERVRGLVTCNGYSIQDIAKAGSIPTAPEQALRHWYQFYFNTEIGRAGLEQKRKELCRLLWEHWSPNWAFAAEDFDWTAETFEGQDWVDTVVHSYRHRYGYAKGDEAYEEMERRLAQQPVIAVPTVVVAGGANGVEPVDLEDAKRGMFTGWYQRIVLDKVGHCVLAEAVEEVARAVETLMEKTEKGP